MRLSLQTCKNTHTKQTLESLTLKSGHVKVCGAGGGGTKTKKMAGRGMDVWSDDVVKLAGGWKLGEKLRKLENESWL